MSWNTIQKRDRSKDKEKVKKTLKMIKRYTHTQCQRVSRQSFQMPARIRTSSGSKCTQGQNARVNPHASGVLNYVGTQKVD